VAVTTPPVTGADVPRRGAIGPFPWLSRYRPAWLRPDVFAGVATAAVLLPQAMAYATVAGLPVQYGLYVATVPMLLYAVLGTSRVLSVSTTSTVAAITATGVALVVSEGSASAVTAAATIAVMAGVILLVAGALKLGFLADFISAPVLAGFKIGTALVIMAGQLGKVLGVPVEGDGSIAKVRSALSQLDDVNVPTLVLAATTVLGLLVLRWFSPRIPGALVAFIGGIVAVAVLDLSSDGVELVSAVPSGLPAPALPDLGLLTTLLPTAFGVALMTFVESIASARAFEDHDDAVPLSADRELLALGVAGVGGGVFRAMPAAGGLSQTAVNAQNGARSPIAGAVTGAFAVVTLLFLTPLFANLAEATLGAIVLVAVLGLLDTAAIRAIGRIRRRDYLLGLVAVVAIVLFGVLQGVLVSVVLSLLALIYGVNRMPLRVLGRDANGRLVEVDKGGIPEPGLVIVRPEGPLYFANVGRIRERLVDLVSGDPPPTTLVIDASAVPDVETTAAISIAELERGLAERGITVWIVAPTPRAARMLEASLEPAARARIRPTIGELEPILIMNTGPMLDGAPSRRQEEP
jgi:SulP family sulfate permease